MRTLIIKDETATGKILNEITLRFNSEYISIKELIAQRLEKEIQLYQSKVGLFRNGLVVPTDIEKRLNNKKAPPTIDIKKQIKIAQEAFDNNGFFILVDDEQVDSLDQKFLIDESTNFVFIKLTPLVGG